MFNKKRSSYYLISVSTKDNLDLCIKHSLAGFTSSLNGLWAYIDIEEGDFISFLYGAKVYNLYEVERKEAIKDAQDVGPWEPITFRSGKRYYFPFRLYLKPKREFCESIVKPEFAYVAENLLLRGGYRKTHFQADQTTLQVVSQLGSLYKKNLKEFKINNKETFVPKIRISKELKNSRIEESISEVYNFKEIILQCLIKKWLSNTQNLKKLFESLNLELSAEEFEVLGEKALPEGHVDILIKNAIPCGSSTKIIIEAKIHKVQPKDVKQLEKYIKEIGQECKCGILLAKEFSEKIINLCENKNIKCFTYSFDNINQQEYSIEELMNIFNINLTRRKV